MEKPHVTNAVYASFLIIVGIIGFILSYFDSGLFQFTALIPSFFGIVLLLFTKGVMNQEPIASHLIVVITMLLALMVSVMLILNVMDGFVLSRKVIIFLVVLAGSVITLGIYIARFISIKRGKS